MKHERTREAVERGNRYGRKCTCDDTSAIYGQEKEGGGVLSLFKAY